VFNRATFTGPPAGDFSRLPFLFPSVARQVNCQTWESLHILFAYESLQIRMSGSTKGSTSNAAPPGDERALADRLAHSLSLGEASSSQQAPLQGTLGVSI
jgi:hypothetical protein